MVTDYRGHNRTPITLIQVEIELQAIIDVPRW